MLEIRAARVEDYEAWRPLWDSYLEFYETTLSDEVTLNTWKRIVSTNRSPGGVQGFIAESSGVVVGFAHCFLRPTTWHKVGYVYLEDLFVAPLARGGGIGRALMEACANYARSIGAERLYWLTQEKNEKARELYDSFNRKGRSEFIHYEYLL